MRNGEPKLGVNRLYSARERERDFGSGADLYCDSTDLKQRANYIPALGDNLNALSEQLMALTIS
ncbi:hypothetical protein H5410_006794 [Solanum commersonii]|uniref:Uncharacterized protein n=1 Tax=Solanum commersonii TaxID=4109 RepID=A0A9J6AAR9_SOLCO|nr:hypothetical protein H5410_006794 [Solanum commersonii]